MTTRSKTTRSRFQPLLAALIIAVVAMPVALSAGLAATAALTTSAQAAPGEPKVKTAKKQRAVKRVPRGIGFLPGYRTPQQIERQEYEQTQRERRAYYRAGGPRIAYWRDAQPQFFRGRWNGGDFGACWKSTPIGYMWTCGR